MQTFLLQIMQTFDYRLNYDFLWDDTWEYSKMTSRTSSGTFPDVVQRRLCGVENMSQSKSNSAPTHHYDHGLDKN